MRPAMLVSALILAGCACESAGHADAGRPAPSPPRTPDAEETVVREWLRAQAVSDRHFGASVLYAWLTDAEAEAVRGGASITAVGEGPPTPLDTLVASPTSDLERQLASPSHPGRRAAWPAPWGTRTGWDDARPPGDHLARIELRPESLLALVDTRTMPHEVRFSTDRGAEVAMGEALLVPELWAAVLVVGTRERAYFLVAPEMIGRVSLGSPEIANELRTDRDRVLGLARQVPDAERSFDARAIRQAWEAIPTADAELDVLLTAALPAPDRVPTGRRGLAALASELVTTDTPFEWRTSLPSEPRPRFFE